MRDGHPGPSGSRGSGPVEVPALIDRDPPPRSEADASASVIVTEVSPFHCLYQDALDFHTQSRLMLARSVGGSSRLARASFLLYVAAAESLVHQAAIELGRPGLAPLLADASRPMRLEDAMCLLPAIVDDGTAPSGDFSTPPWPQFSELLMLRDSWTYPGPPSDRRAYYLAATPGADYEPLQPHQVRSGLGISAVQLLYPRTGLPRDPYALRPHHLDTARGVLDAMIESLDRQLDGALTRGNRHRREPIRVLDPPSGRTPR